MFEFLMYLALVYAVACMLHVIIEPFTKRSWCVFCRLFSLHDEHK